MVFEASDYLIWMVFIFLETLAVRFSRNRQDLQPIRYFMALCLMRDFILLAWSCHLKYYWMAIWIGNQVEWAALELVVVLMISRHWAWKLFPLMILGICLYYDIAKNWPMRARPEEIFHLERNMTLIILGTLLIGALFIFARNQLPIAVSVTILALAGMVSAQSFLLENYSPRLASAVWILGLGTLVTVLRANPERRHMKQHATQAHAAAITDSSSGQKQPSESQSTSIDVSLRLQELSVLPCRTRIQ